MVRSMWPKPAALIGSWMRSPWANRYQRQVKAEEFQVWTLTRDKRDNGATLDCGDGNGNTVYSKRIPFTDFPLDTVRLFCEGGTILLPSEH